ncbi:MAG TPA: glucose-6-phosphate isomerase [Myxococcaceae bacterium]|nr:glucose-6-phosphate isomerase [Myxococcaceae bacterium]
MAEGLRLDVNLAMDEQIGEAGLRRADLEALASKVKAVHQNLSSERRAGRLPFFDLPRDRAAAEAAAALARELSEEHENLLVLGIGGSSLGAKALFTALCHPLHNLLDAKGRRGMRLFFPDNADPATFAGLLEVLDLDRTAAAAITKSGGTAETWSQLLVLREKWLSRGGEAALRRHLVAVTDPEKGALRAVARAAGWRTLPVPPLVGGRFSVLTAVGLLPAAAAGIDIHELLAGAAEMAARCESDELTKNPAYLAASILYLADTARGRKIHVFMPYADALRETSDWFVQLWAESLGKTPRIGPTPLRAVGATDQHSLVQLLMEGPQDKLTVFVRIERPRADLPLPAGWADQGDVSYLSGHTMHELLNVEHQATAAALAAAGRPSITVRLPALTPRAMGELLMLWEIATAFAGGLYGVSPFDQPGVEAGKRFIGGLLSRPGYQKHRAELERRPIDPKWIV